jgi:hypothetical protein
MGNISLDLKRLSKAAPDSVYRFVPFRSLLPPHRGHLMISLPAWLSSCQNSPGNTFPQCGQFITFLRTYFISCQTGSKERKRRKVAAEKLEC